MAMPVKRRNVASILLCLPYLMLLAKAETDIIPHIESVNTSGTFQHPHGKPWVPGPTTQLTFLPTGTPLAIHINVAGGGEFEFLKPVSHHLLYKCSSKDSRFKQIVLLDANRNSAGRFRGNYCTELRQFKFEKLSDSKYTVTLLKGSRISFDQSLEHSIELRVLVMFHSNFLESQSLFIFNIDSVLNINIEPITSRGVTYRRFILTDEAIKFMTAGGNIAASAAPFVAVNFLEKRFIDLVMAASQLIRSILSVDVEMEREGPCSGGGCGSVSKITFTTGNVRSYRNPNEFSLCLETGRLFANKDVLSALNAMRNQRIRISVSLSLERIMRGVGNYPYDLKETVMEYTLNAMYPALADSPSICTTDGGKTDSSVTLFHIYGFAHVDSPIVCSSKQESATAVLNGERCTKPIDGMDGWTSCHSLAMLAPMGTTMTLMLQAASMNIKSFAFRTSNITANFKVNTVQLPVFYDDLHLDSLPPVTHAQLGKKVSFNCIVRHSNSMKQVLMRAAFLVFRESHSSTHWHELTPTNFASEMLNQPPSVVRQERETLDNEHSLIVTLPPVTTKWKEWKMSFVCRASVMKQDARRLLGIPEYHAESRTAVFYVD